jgi:hypothetical protein
MGNAIGRYAKGISSLVTHGLLFAAMYYGTNHWVAAAIAVAGSLGITAVPNSASKAPTVIYPPPRYVPPVEPKGPAA